MSSVDEALAQVLKERNAGNYRGALELVRPFLLASCRRCRSATSC
jgi:hypothetical protein